MPKAQWGRLLMDNGQPQFTDQAVGLTIPATGDVQAGVVCAGWPKATIRVWNSSDPNFGTFDVRVFRLYDTSEPWFFDADIGTVGITAVAPGNQLVAEIETRGAIRLFVLVDNFAAGARATTRSSGGTD